MTFTLPHVATRSPRPHAPNGVVTRVEANQELGELDTAFTLLLRFEHGTEGIHRITVYDSKVARDERTRAVSCLHEAGAYIVLRKRWVRGSLVRLLEGWVGGVPILDGKRRGRSRSWVGEREGTKGVELVLVKG